MTSASKLCAQSCNACVSAGECTFTEMVEFQSCKKICFRVSMGTDELIKQLSDVIDEELDASLEKMEFVPQM